MLIAIDFETTGLDFWSKSFAVKSMAIAYMSPLGDVVGKCIYEGDIYKKLKEMIENGDTMLVYNIGFEYGVLKHYYGLEYDNIIDVMRLVQVYGSPNRVPLDLKYSISRFLPNEAGYEREIKKWIFDNCKVRAKKWGAHIHEAPKEILERYNVADAVLTYKLYKFLERSFKSEGYDWKIDHSGYIYLSKCIVDAQAAGICIDREHALRARETVIRMIENDKKNFMEKHADGIYQVRLKLKEKLQGKYKRKIIEELPEFNISSKKHLEFLFCDIYGIKPPRTTQKGRPSFKAAHLKYWQGAEDLVKLGNRNITLNQIEKCLQMSESDGKIHLGLKTCGTKTGRFAGTGGLNQQGLNRKSKELMRCFVAKPGYVFVSSDGAAMEPTITSEYTQDKNYKYCTFDGIGKEPFYKDGILYIDDIYLMVLSILPFGVELMQEMFNKDFGGKTFAQQWLEDKEVIVKEIKQQRTTAKIIVLGLSYGMQPKRLYKTMAEAEIKTTLKECELIYNRYWELFKGIKSFADRVKKEVELYGNLVNPFGYRMRPEPHKAFNALIQSSVNGVIYLYLRAVLELARYAEFVTVIHDEILFQVPIEKLDDFKQKIKEATDKVNKTLEWSIPMRFGFAAGETLYEAK